MNKLFRQISRLLPDGLAARFALLLVVALITANIVALTLFSFERERLDRSALLDREIERIVTLVPIMDATDRVQRNVIAQEASTRVARISVGSKPLVRERVTNSRWNGLLRQMSEALPERTIRIGLIMRQGDDWRDDRHDGSDQEQNNRQIGFGVSVALEASGNTPQQWLNVVLRSDRTSPPSSNGLAFAGLLALSLIAVLGVGLVFVRLLTKPLRNLAMAAKAAGEGDRSARVAETGAREMREAASAFNDMQERIAQFDAERMRTLAAVGHDLRTPITSLRIRAEMLDEPDGAPMIHTLDEMTVMANGLVAYAKGAAESEATQDINLVEFLKVLCADRGAECHFDETIAIKARPVALGRAIGNLIDNALRYGDAARVSATQDKVSVSITIADDGPGIAAENIDHMFEPFMRGEDSRSLETGGAGLGLSIARSIIIAHGGTVTLQNRKEGGLFAIVRLPKTI